MKAFSDFATQGCQKISSKPTRPVDMSKTKLGTDPKKGLSYLLFVSFSNIEDEADKIDKSTLNFQKRIIGISKFRKLLQLFKSWVYHQ